MIKWYEKLVASLLTASFIILIVAICCGALKISFIVLRWVIYGIWG